MGLILVKSDLQLLFFVFCPRETRLVLLKILLIPFFLFLLVMPIPRSAVISFFFMSDFVFLFFFFYQAGYPALVNPVCNSFIMSRIHFLGLVFFIAGSSGRPEGNGHEGEWQGTRIIMSFLMCHAGSIIGFIVKQEF